MNPLLLRQLASIVAQSSPLVFASIGETITEKAGVINLSLDGTILLAAMTAFVVAFRTGSLVLGFAAAMAVGAALACLVAFGSIALRQDQVAIGFVLTLLADDLSAFLGQPYTRTPGPFVRHTPIPILKDIPILGPIFFNHNIVVYLSLLLIIATWLWMYKTQPGLRLQGIGERPEAAFARGTNVNRMRYVYTIVGGALVGFAGAAFSLSVKLGWSEGHTRGTGWIALAIVIFGGWHPFRVAFGAYLFGGLKTVVTTMQRVFPGVPVVLFNTTPWVLLILTLLLVGSGAVERLLAVSPPPVRRVLRGVLRSTPPAALGTTFVKE
ncbi:MAG: ABC transporter permease [Anaerolineae bacterium]